jgi:hypothetical protein
MSAVKQEETVRISLYTHDFSIRTPIVRELLFLQDTACAFNVRARFPSLFNLLPLQLFNLST